MNVARNGALRARWTLEESLGREHLRFGTEVGRRVVVS